MNETRHHLKFFKIKKQKKISVGGEGISVVALISSHLMKRNLVSMAHETMRIIRN